MKTTHKLLVLTALAVGALNLSAQQPADAPADTNSPNAAKPEDAAPPPATTNDTAAPPTQANTPAPAENTNAAPQIRTDGLITMNFRGASLESVLNHMSEAAGYIINVKPGVSVRGKVDMWSSRALTKEQAFNLLQTVLHQNNLAAIENEGTLNIIPLDEAKINGVRVILQKDPKLIPRNDEIATYIIPVQFVEASQLLKDLQPLVSSQNTTMTANESGNSIVITDTQANIHRVAEIISNIDSGAQSFTEVRRFKLKNSDPNDIADLLSNLFPDESQSGRGGSGNNPFSRFASRFGGGGGGFPGGGGGFPGGGGPPGFLGGGQGQGGANGSDQRAKKRTRVIAVAEQRTSSVVVQANKELMEQVADVIDQIDNDNRGRLVSQIFNVEYTDMTQLNQVLQDMFQRRITTQNRNNSQNMNNNNALQSRTSTTGNGSSGRSSTGTGFGSSSGRSGGTGSLLQP